MKLDIIKKKFVKEAAVIGGILFVLAAVFYYISSYKTSLEDKLTDISRDSANISRKARTSKVEYDNFVVSLESYRQISKTRLPTQEGYDNTASRIRIARPIIEELKEKFRFPSLDVTFSNITDKTEDYKTKTLSIISNEINIRFEGMSDEIVFSFVNSLIEELPGYVRLKKLSIRRIQDITQNTIISAKNSIALAPVVSGDIVFTWFTTKETNESKKGL